jgi:hypothetical protein
MFLTLDERLRNDVTPSDDVPFMPKHAINDGSEIQLYLYRFPF